MTLTEFLPLWATVPSMVMAPAGTVWQASSAESDQRAALGGEPAVSDSKSSHRGRLEQLVVAPPVPPVPDDVVAVVEAPPLPVAVLLDDTDDDDEEAAVAAPAPPPPVLPGLVGLEPTHATSSEREAARVTGVT